MCKCKFKVGDMICDEDGEITTILHIFEYKGSKHYVVPSWCERDEQEDLRSVYSEKRAVENGWEKVEIRRMTVAEIEEELGHKVEIISDEQ